MSWLQEDSSVEVLKTAIGILLGLACLMAGWIIFTTNGFYVPLVFLAGVIMMPLGVLVLGSSLTGGLGESPRDIIARHRQKTQWKRRAD